MLAGLVMSQQKVSAVTGQYSSLNRPHFVESWVHQ